MWPRIFSWGVPAGAGLLMMALPETGWLGQEVARLVFWAGLAIVAICVVGLLVSYFNAKNVNKKRWRWMWKLKIQKQDRWPIRRLMPLKMAACRAYEETKQTVGIQAMESIPSCDRSTLLGFMAQKLVDESVNVFGRCPPSNKQDQLPADHAAVYQFNNEATEMYDIDKDVNRYVDLEIMCGDLKRRIKELLATNGAR